MRNTNPDLASISAIFASLIVLLSLPQPVIAVDIVPVLQAAVSNPNEPMVQVASQDSTGLIHIHYWSSSDCSWDITLAPPQTGRVVNVEVDSDTYYPGVYLSYDDGKSFKTQGDRSYIPPEYEQQNCIAPAGWVLLHDFGYGPATAIGPWVPTEPTANDMITVRPNPSTRETRVEFELTEPGHTRILITDATGRVIRRLMDDVVTAGPQSVNWNGCDEDGAPVSTGIYFLHIETADRLLPRKVIRLR